MSFSCVNIVSSWFFRVGLSPNDPAAGFSHVASNILVAGAGGTPLAEKSLSGTPLDASTHSESISIARHGGGVSLQSFCRITGRRDQTQTSVSGRQRGVAPADDYGGKGMKISPEQARLNIVREYERQHQEGVNALAAAIAKRQGTKTDNKAETEQTTKPELSKLLLKAAQESE
jgi:hypothetical protein